MGFPSRHGGTRGFRGGHSHRKPGPPTVAFARDLDPAAMHLHQPFHQRKSDPESAAGAFQRLAHLGEHVEDLGELLARNPDAGVLDENELFATVTLGVAALNVLAPVAILSAVRKPVDYYTFNPWLKRLPEYLASDSVPFGEKLAKLPDLALFWFSAGRSYGGAEWGFAVDVADAARILLISETNDAWLV